MTIANKWNSKIRSLGEDRILLVYWRYCESSPMNEKFLLRILITLWKRKKWGKNKIGIINLIDDALNNFIRQVHTRFSKSGNHHLLDLINWSHILDSTRNIILKLQKLQYLTKIARFYHLGYSAVSRTDSSKIKSHSSDQKQNTKIGSIEKYLSYRAWLWLYLLPLNKTLLLEII